MMVLLLNLLQQQGRLSKVVIVGAVLIFLAGLSLLVYFYRRYKRIEKEPEEDWGASRHSLFANVAPSAESAGETAAKSNVAAISEEASASVGTREFASEIAQTKSEPEMASPAEPQPPPEQPTRPVFEAEAPREPRPTEVLASPQIKEPPSTIDAEPEATAFDDELWAGLEIDEQRPGTHGLGSETTPLQSSVEPPAVARVDERPHLEPFEPPRIDRIVHREAYEPPTIEPLTPREQASATRALRSTPPQSAEPAERTTQRAARETGLFGSIQSRSSEQPSVVARPKEPLHAETRELAAQPVAASAGRLTEPSIAGGYARKAPAGSILGLPAEASHGPLILGSPVRAESETGIGALTNYGKDLSEKSGRAGTIALLVVVALLGGAIAVYFFVPSVHSGVNGFVARMRGTDAASQLAMKTRAQIIPSYRPEVNKNMVTARGAVDNISDEPLENLSVEIQLQRGADAPPEIRTVSVTPNPLPPGQRGTFEFEYDGKRDTGFVGYKITKLLSNDAEVKFRAPGK